MAVIIGSARSDEYGHARGGQAGDQTGKEVSTQEWYLHAKGWRVFRPLDPEAAKLIAQDMQYAADNQNIGYDQDERDTLFAAAKKVKFDCSKVSTKCETDCSALVRVCVNYAGIPVGDFYTGDEAQVLMSTGAFKELTDHRFTTSANYLKRGDILVTKTKGHTAIVLTNGIYADPDETPVNYYVFSVAPVKKDSEGAHVLLCQELLKVKGYKGANGKVLQLDGHCGNNTVYAINSFQSAMRKQGIECGTNGQNDGSCGKKCWKALLGL